MIFQVLFCHYIHQDLFSSARLKNRQLEKKTINLDLARHTIEMIAMLKEKTKGNLTEEEDNLLNALLSEIRLAYVEAKA
mgnify:CR=1 FL=1